MDKSILWSIIKSQAGTLGKAVLELVMNSIDAGATKVQVTLTGTHLTVSDDGRGFQSREEIENWFETFGTPHEKGDARYGRFRMGRGQVMAFTRNRWRSGAFAMAVDIRDMGLAYDLTAVDGKPHKGCQIEGELYDPLSPAEVIRVTDNLRELCKYAPIPVLVNGDRVSVKLDKEKWTFVDDDAYYLLRPQARALEVYNLGVHVRNYFGDYGIGGIVVSKQQLEVNFARNDILLAECAVWKRIAQKVRAHAKQFEEKKPTQNDAYRDMMLGRLLSGSFETLEEMTDALENAKVFTDYSGKHHSLTGLHRAGRLAGNAIAVPDDYSLKADKVHQRKLALVISPKTIERARHMALPEIFERIAKNLATFMGSVRHGAGYSATYHLEELQKMLRPIDEVAGVISENHHIVDDKELSKHEKLVLRVLRDLSYQFRAAVPGCNTDREIRVCESETVDGFTDGRTKIFIERKFLKIGGSAGHAFKAFDALKHLLLHEYLHDADDSTGHGHPQEFYQAFHDILSDERSRIAGFTYDAVMRYVAIRRKAGIKMRAGDLHALDLVTLEDEPGDEADETTAMVEATEVAAAAPAPQPEEPKDPIAAVVRRQEQEQFELVV
ncbi:ATP-binding protein [Methylibium petroleiphilum]|uniref:Uncharacterized protein n=1 Tax=Methylibium petroleiphilum (strain ATCC BAA-1232 / LMG 22953 / PM1) TaxID=420662 RepID=A2SNE5_METPP|nr:ATP-binding protein [Methylibium petroleiphilum]ABM97084.1 hypothetical protein Mpe_B0309 [Methylibium petroleiphilum PM1]